MIVPPTVPRSTNEMKHARRAAFGNDKLSFFKEFPGYLKWVIIKDKFLKLAI